MTTFVAVFPTLRATLCDTESLTSVFFIASFYMVLVVGYSMTLLLFSGDGTKADLNWILLVYNLLVQDHGTQRSHITGHFCMPWRRMNLPVLSLFMLFLLVACHPSCGKSRFVMLCGMGLRSDLKQRLEKHAH
jgi:hypothetical protein